MLTLLAHTLVIASVIGSNAIQTPQIAVTQEDGDVAISGLPANTKLAKMLMRRMQTKEQTFAQSSGTGPLSNELVGRKSMRREDKLVRRNTSTAGGGLSESLHKPTKDTPPTSAFTTPLGLKLGDFEREVYQRINMTTKKYGIPARFPVPATPVYLEDSKRGCVLGGGSCGIFEKGFEKKTKFWADPHVRDILASALTPCLFRKEQCLALDLGTNFGYHAMTMLHFNTKVTTVEPEPSLCASFMRSVERNGYADSANIHCGGVSRLQDDNVKWFAQYSPRSSAVYGQPKVPFDYGLYGFSKKGVPYVSLSSLLPPKGSTLQFVKIDTDSIDCDIVTRLLEHLKKKDFDIQHMVFESTGPCQALPNAFRDFQELGYTVYRTLLTMEKFDANGHQPKILPHSVPKYIEEKFDLRFNRYLWQFKGNMTVDEWKKAAGLSWQYYLTKEELESNDMSVSS